MPTTRNPRYSPESWDRARSTVAAMTEDEKLWCLDGDGPFWAGLAYLTDSGNHKSPYRAARVDRVGLDGFAFSDGPRGVVVDQATCFPVSMARGATWDVDLEERIGEAAGRELRAVGADLFGGVCVNVLRHPAWGRAQETYGEDPHHVGEMGAALTRGVQRHAMACVKHFACNSMENARFTVDITVDEVALHEVYLPQFRRIVDEGVAVVMSAYNSVNGQWCGQNRVLLTDVLRGEWGFEGFVISDWLLGLRQAGTSLHAGLDVEMPFRMIRAEHLQEDLLAGVATGEDVDQAVARIIATRDHFADVLGADPPDRSVLACAPHRALAREAAAKSVVLLRNQPVGGQPLLPLDPATVTSVALVGRLATSVNLGDGGSSDVWAPEVTTIADGVEAVVGAARVVVDDGTDLPRAAAVAGAARVTVVVVGYTRLDEGEYIGEFATDHLRHLFPGPDDPDLVESFTAQIAHERAIQPPPHAAPSAAAGGFAEGGDRASLHLHDDDVTLIRAVAAVNPRTVVVVVAGSAVVISEWDGVVPAIVQAWYSGMEGGHGVADVLFGSVDATGRLPFSVPRHAAELPPFQADAQAFTYDGDHGYWYLAQRGTPPAYPFGFGLSYTTFELEEARTDVGDEGLAVTVGVRNTGQRSGWDVVQVYAARRGSSRPERLVAFGRVEVGADGTASVELKVPLSSLAVRDVDTHSMVVRPGTYDLRVAHHASDPGIVTTVELAPGRLTGTH